VPSLKSPFIKKKVVCPVCDSQVENRFIMPKSFVEKDVESDRHPGAYKWLDEEFQTYHPPFYHFWHCTTCKYTATQRDFLKPTQESNNNFTLLKKYYHQLQPSQKQIVQLLGSDINYDNMNFNMAMNLHLLAIFIQEIVPGDAQDTSKLGSYYLRTGWLIREQTAKGDPNGLLAGYKNFLEKLSKLWAEVPVSEPECLVKAAGYYEKAYQGHPRYSDIVTASDLMLLIADIYLRAGDDKRAMQSLNTVMQTGQKFRAKQGELIRREKEAGKLTMARKAQIDAQSSRVNVLMERAGDMRQEIIKKKITEQEPKARAVVEQLTAQGLDDEAIRGKLKELNFEPGLILKLLGEPKRKKFLGLF